MDNRALVEAVALAGVTERFECSMVLTKRLEGILCLHFEDHNHEGTHQEAGIGELGRIGAGTVMENPCICARCLAVGLIELGELTAEAMNHGQVEGSEILVEWHINQILNVNNIMSKVQKWSEKLPIANTYVINIEEEGILVVLRWLGVRHPVKAILDDFYRFSIGHNSRLLSLALFDWRLPLVLLSVARRASCRHRFLLRAEGLLLVTVNLTKLLAHSEVTRAVVVQLVEVLGRGRRLASIQIVL